MVRSSFRSVVFLICLMQLAGCKKDSGHEMWEFSFTYDGQTYNNRDYGSPVEFQGNVIGIEIHKPDVFGGVVKFIWTDTCAFLEPTGMDIFFNYNSCDFVSATPVDSSRIYRYSSGSGSSAASNCKTKTDRLFNVTYTKCTISGTFSLVLINNAGDTKSITGSFKDPDVRQ